MLESILRALTPLFQVSERPAEDAGVCKQASAIAPSQQSELLHEKSVQEALAAAKRAFQQQHGDSYGYQGALEALRAQEFARLGGAVYLDHAGAALYSEAQLEASTMQLKSQLLGNPHSLAGTEAAASSATAAMDAQLRRLTLQMCGTTSEQYEVVFTSGATGALRLLADLFPWTPGRSRFVYTLQNHNSVLGMREAALAAGASAQAVEVAAAVAAHDGGALPAGASRYAFRARGQQMRRQKQQQQQQDKEEDEGEDQAWPASGAAATRRPQQEPAGPPGEEQQACCHLFAYPAECNFSGQRFNPRLAGYVQSHGVSTGAAEGSTTSSSATPEQQQQQRWFVLVDAAKACATRPPDLSCSAQAPDFVVLSYYKIFGHPTGLGALVVKRSALPHLRTACGYFGGGTVLVSLPDQDFHVKRPGAAGLEAGTPPFLDVAAACHGFALIHRLGGFVAIQRHTDALAQQLVAMLQALRHANGRPVCELYGWPPSDGSRDGDAATAGSRSTKGDVQSTSGCSSTSSSGGGAVCGNGPTVAFNLLAPDGAYVGYTQLQQLAALHRVHLRTGCFCNPGACQAFLGMCSATMRANYQRGHVCWDQHDLMDGRPTGAVRVSLGYSSTFEDTYALLALLQRYFVDDSVGGAATTVAATGGPAGSISTTSSITSSSSRGQQAQDQSSAAGGGGAAAQCGQQPTPVVSQLLLYPIKSCAPQAVQAWPLGPHGLLLDRQWALVDEAGRVVTQKGCPRLALVRPCVDLQAGALTIACAASAAEPLVVRLDGAVLMGQALPEGLAAAGASVGSSAQQQTASSSSTEGDAPGHEAASAAEVRVLQMCGTRVCGVLVAGAESQAAVQRWFSEAVGLPLRLAQQAGGEQRQAVAPVDLPQVQPSLVGFANEGQFLVVNAASVEALNRSVQAEQQQAAGAAAAPPAAAQQASDVLKFRPNVVVAGCQAFAEDAWRCLTVGQVRLAVCRPCSRCDVVQVDPATGERGGPALLRALAGTKRQQEQPRRSRLDFGLLCALMDGQQVCAKGGNEAGAAQQQQQSQGGMLRVGDPVVVQTYQDRESE